jgi:hypothetical protein
LDIEIDLNGQIFTFTTRGYGATADDAINNARDAKQWLPVFADAFNARNDSD